FLPFLASLLTKVL
uniref:Temporin-1Cc n=1 Tax=Lithobates clamitans TaxID=145282 RepID=TP1C_LITCL|nr:RecName: Full=Temporin-1Cc [Lithobates clamitans]